MAEALRFYSSHTAQIEVVRHDRTLEQVKIDIQILKSYIVSKICKIIFFL